MYLTDKKSVHMDYFKRTQYGPHFLVLFRGGSYGAWLLHSFPRILMTKLWWGQRLINLAESDHNLVAEKSNTGRCQSPWALICYLFSTDDCKLKSFSSAPFSTWPQIYLLIRRNECGRGVGQNLTLDSVTQGLNFPVSSHPLLDLGPTCISLWSSIPYSVKRG